MTAVEDEEISGGGAVEVMQIVNSPSLPTPTAAMATVCQASRPRFSLKNRSESQESTGSLGIFGSESLRNRSESLWQKTKDDDEK